MLSLKNDMKKTSCGAAMPIVQGTAERFAKKRYRKKSDSV